MKAEDLMVGDFVLFKNKIVCVKGVFAYMITIKDNSMIGQEDLSPIPITPEILEKNGFKYNKKYNAYKIILKDGEDLIYYIGQKSLYLFISHNNEHDWDEELHVYMENVHEMQHALRLMKINKKIEL